jgi:hypothetical protein
MFYARAMYLGSDIIDCDEHIKYLSYSSYKELGLCCIACKQRVFFKGLDGILKR